MTDVQVQHRWFDDKTSTWTPWYPTYFDEQGTAAFKDSKGLQIRLAPGFVAGYYRVVGSPGLGYFQDEGKFGEWIESLQPNTLVEKVTVTSGETAVVKPSGPVKANG